VLIFFLNPEHLNILWISTNCSQTYYSFFILETLKKNSANALYITVSAVYPRYDLSGVKRVWAQNCFLKRFKVSTKHFCKLIKILTAPFTAVKNSDYLRVFH